MSNKAVCIHSLYPYVSHFHHILVLHNRTRIYALILPRSNIDKPKQTGLFINIGVFLISVANKFSVKNFVV